ncbi:hypothetical protein ACP275_08G087600 [Erythranthe tilingii]
MIRAHAQVIRAALLFKLAGQRAIVLGTTVAPPSPNGDYEIGLEQLASMNRDHNITALQQYGGVKGLAEMIKTDVETGIYGDENELSRRKNAFGSNTYPVKKGRSFLRFLWEAWQDLTLIILIIAAVASLTLGIKIENLLCCNLLDRSRFNFVPCLDRFAEAIVRARDIRLQMLHELISRNSIKSWELHKIG